MIKVIIALLVYLYILWASFGTSNYQSQYCAENGYPVYVKVVSGIYCVDEYRMMEIR